MIMNRPLRVLHLSTSDIRGGAAKGSFALHQALRRAGVDSQMLVGRKHSDDPLVGELCRTAAVIERARGVLDTLPLRMYRKSDDSFWSVGWLSRRIDRVLAQQDPDVIHMHWTGGGFLPVKALAGVRQPVVWTLRDMWAFTGGCHYTAGCDGYEAQCGRCPQLSSDNENDLSHRMWRHKFAAWRQFDVSVVAISSWLADCARASGLFDHATIDVIPNGIDTAVFRPYPRDQARAVLGLTPGRRHVVYGALGALSDRRKGYLELVQALQRINAFTSDNDIVLSVFGNASPAEMPAMNIEVRDFGPIDDDRTLAMLYAAGDVMVVPSLQEAFGKTLVEAMACGTPVVAFNSGGPADIVVHRETGYLAEAFEPTDLARGIAWCVETPGRIAQLGDAARKRTEVEYSIDHIGNLYRDMYQRLLETAA